MPVTVRLSRKFYEKFGEDVANELVDLLNSVDTPGRAEFRELMELSLARFDAKLEQRLAESDVRWERRLGDLRAEIREVKADRNRRDLHGSECHDCRVTPDLTLQDRSPLAAHRLNQ